MPDRNLAPAAARYWAAALLALGSLLGVCAWREEPPSPRPSSAPATEFSADRAWPVLSYLADTIQYRVAGTPGADSAKQYLAAILRRIPGVEVEVQEVSGALTAPRGYYTTAYTLHNVLARIPGRSREALLLSAHYDTPAGSVGAGDDAIAVASLVETVRALAAGPPLEHSIIVNLNDGEEQGLLGAHGFIRHRWFRDVRAFVNLESAGPHGKAILFQAGPGGGWLVSAYARSVPYPYGTVLAQDIFQSGAIPSDTDFRIYRDNGGLVGLDIALFRGGWAYHTQRDRTWNVSRGTVQHMGENALALARVLANGPLSAIGVDGVNGAGERAGAEEAGDAGKVVFYDVLGAFMPHYSLRTAGALALLAIALGFAALVLVIRRESLSARELAISFLAVLVSALAAPAAALALGAAAAYGAGRPMSWFAHPYWATAAFAFATLSGVLGVQRLFVRSPTAARRVSATHGALLLFWMLALGALTLMGVGSAYIALWWVLGTGASLVAVSLDHGRRWWLWILLGALPASMLTVQILVTLTQLFVPVFGRLPVAIAPDLILGVLVALPATALALALVPGAHLVGAVGRACLGAGALSVALFAASLAQDRYTELHPQRLAIRHLQHDRDTTLWVYGMDYITPRRALAQLPGMQPAPGQGKHPLSFVSAVGPTGFAAPRLELIADRPDTVQGTRTLTFRTHSPGAFRLRILAPFDRVAGWSIPASLPSGPGKGGYLQLDYVAPPDTGVRFSLRVRGSKRVAIYVEATHFATTPAAAAVMRALPPWTDAHAVAVNGAWMGLRGSWFRVQGAGTASGTGSLPRGSSCPLSVPFSPEP